MAIVHLLVPEGFSPETRMSLIEKTKQAVGEGLHVPVPAAVSIFLSEIQPENMCEDAKKKRVIIVYTTMGKPLEDKRLVGELFERACAEALGDQKGDTFVIFKEHTLENLCARGKIRIPV